MHTSPPRILLAVIADQPTDALSFYLSCIDALDYPKSAIELLVRTSSGTRPAVEILTNWIARVGDRYARLDVDGLNRSGAVNRSGSPAEAPSPAVAQLRQQTMNRTLETNCDFYFTADSNNFLRPNTLRCLVELGVPIVSPLLRHVDSSKLYSNFHEQIDENGYFVSSEAYYWLLERKIRGLCQVPVVHSCYLVRRDVIPKLTFDDGSGRLTYVIFSDSARKHGVLQYLDNREVYGYLNPDGDAVAATRLLAREIAEATAECVSAPDFLTGRSTLPIFIHSSWRTSSTWIWLKFRQLRETMCYYEPFHGLLATRTREEASTIDFKSWDSNHPQSDPYGLEYLALIRETGGIPFSEPAMAFQWFIPAGGLGGELRPTEKKYLRFLIRYAELSGKTPVLGDTRTLGRIRAIKATIGGYHIFVHRNLWLQWASYLYYKRLGNFYFYDTMAWILANNGDRYLSYLIEYCRERECQSRAPTRPHREHPSEAIGQEGQLGSWLPNWLRTSPDRDVFTVFMAFHIYLYLHAELATDLTIDVTKMARDDAYRCDVERQLAERTLLPVSFYDIRDERRLQPTEIDAEAIDWDRIREHAAAAVVALSGFGDAKRLARKADEFINAALAEALR
jgi:hypothetical protein